MIPADILPWQESNWLHLQSAQGRLPHSLLFGGPAGLGKFAFAQKFSAALLCNDPGEDGSACEKCKSCHLLKVGNHPDFRITSIEEDASVISVGQVRELISYLALRPHTSSRRVVILAPAEAMNINAANSLLKILEEPPSDSVLILVSHRPQLLSATIRSRCTRFDFRPPSPPVGVEWLAGQGIKQAAALDLLAAAGGAPLRAVELGQLGFTNAQNMMITDLVELQSGTADPVECAVRWKAIGAEYSLSWFSGLVADLVQYRSTSGRGERLNNPSRIEAIRKLAKSASRERLFALLDQSFEATRLASTPLDDTLLIEDILIGWCKTGI